MRMWKLEKWGCDVNDGEERESKTSSTSQQIGQEMGETDVGKSWKNLKETTTLQFHAPPILPSLAKIYREYSFCFWFLVVAAGSTCAHELESGLESLCQQ